MKLDELKHVLRASAAIADENSMVVVGSQAILLLLDEPPESLLVSREVDLYPALHPERADLIDGAIGMHSSFHETFGYFADGVGPETAVMPADTLRERIAMLEATRYPLTHIQQWVERRRIEAKAAP